MNYCFLPNSKPLRNLNNNKYVVAIWSHTNNTHDKQLQRNLKNVNFIKENRDRGKVLKQAEDSGNF